MFTLIALQDLFSLRDRVRFAAAEVAQSKAQLFDDRGENQLMIRVLENQTGGFKQGFLVVAGIQTVHRQFAAVGR
nr:hypothetical protein [Reinekea blandensis]